LQQSILRVAEYRKVALVLLKTALADYAGVAQQRWLAWLKKQRLDAAIPTEFSRVLDLVTLFADPVITGEPVTGTWNPARKSWI
jgi:hypothetical protein